MDRFMDLEEQIKSFDEIGKKIEELEKEKKALGIAIMGQMQEKTVQVASYIVRRCSRLSIKLSIEDARSLDAIQLEESIDRKKIKALFRQGAQIPGVSETHYIQIGRTPPKKEGDSFSACGCVHAVSLPNSDF
jgi:hypothetical protein